MMSPIGIIDAGYNMDSGYVYAKFITGDIVLIVRGKLNLPSRSKNFFHCTVSKSFSAQ